MSSEDKKVHFVSLGCPKNQVDTEVMLGSLMNEGYRVTDSKIEADTIVVNTCGFIESSKAESISKILEMSDLKKSGSLKKLVVAGCLTQRYKEELVKDLPEADLFIGSGEFQNIAGILKDQKQGPQRKSYYDAPTFLQDENSPRVNSEPFYRAYLKISEGCKKRCSFCAIPLIKGNLQSRKIESVVSEAQLLVAGGVKEINVVSHDFTDYGWDIRKKGSENQKTTPYQLLKALSDKSGAQWIRVLYLYPDGITAEMVRLIKERDNLVKYFDMPLQHINNQMLKSMNRRMTREEIEKAIRLIREEIPEAVVRTQFIVGFPGETEEQFQELVEFVKKQKFDRVGCFKYSFEEETKSGKMADQISEDVKQRRYDELMKTQVPISREIHQKLIGRTFDVVVEGESEETELLLQGRNSQQAPEIDGVTYINEGEARVGDVVKVCITDAHDYDLVGHIVESP